MDFLEPNLTRSILTLFVSAFISSTLAPGGSEAVLAYLVSEKQNDNLTLLASATLGNTLGALTTWFIGVLAAAGYSIKKSRIDTESKSMQIIRRWGVAALLFSWLPIVGDALCLAAGWLKLPFVKSLAAIFVGKFFRYAMIVYLVERATSG